MIPSASAGSNHRGANAMVDAIVSCPAGPAPAEDTNSAIDATRNRTATRNDRLTRAIGWFSLRLERWLTKPLPTCRSIDEIYFAQAGHRNTVERFDPNTSVPPRAWDGQGG